MMRAGVALALTFGTLLVCANAGMDCPVPWNVENVSMSGPCMGVPGNWDIDYWSTSGVPVNDPPRRLATGGFDPDELDQLPEFDDSNINRLLLEKESGPNVTHGDMCYAQCKPGFHPNLMDPRLNCTNGTLDPPTFTCLQNTCDGPQAFDCGMNADCAGGGEGAGVTCTCQTGFAGAMTTNMKAMCTEYNCGSTGAGVINCGASATCSVTSPGVTCTCNTGYVSLATPNVQPSCVEYTCDSSGQGSFDCGAGAVCSDASPGVACTCAPSLGYFAGTAGANQKPNANIGCNEITNCTAPMGIVNVSMNGACAEGSMIIHGSMCTPQCEANTFVWHSGMPSTPGLSCNDGVLTPDTFTCGPQCQVPSGLMAPMNGALGAVCQGPMTSGASCALTCTSGYAVTGTQPKCNDGVFDAGDITCVQENNCTTPISAPENGALDMACSASVLASRLTCALTCNTGYTVTGVQPSCTMGTFMQGSILCADNNCTVAGVSAPTNGALDMACANGAKLMNGESCALTCNSGYTVSGSQPSCSSTADFSAGGPVTCAGDSCTVSGLSAPSNGALDTACSNSSTLAHGASCTLTCGNGYTLSGTHPSCTAGTFAQGSVSCAVTSGGGGATTTTAAYQVVATTTLQGAATATIQGSMAMTVADPTAFAANVTIRTGLQNAVASMAGVNPANVEVTVTLGGRRLDTDYRRLAGTVTVSYVITVAASDSAGITSILTGKTAADVKTTIELALAAVGASGVTVVVTTTPSAQVVGAAAGSQRTHGVVATTATFASMAVLMASLW